MEHIAAEVRYFTPAYSGLWYSRFANLRSEPHANPDSPHAAV